MGEKTQKAPFPRVIFERNTENEGPVVIFTGGIHGNEPSGVYALKKVFNDDEIRSATFKGSVYAYSGNIAALEAGKRYMEKDLNRLWTRSRIEMIESKLLRTENADPDTGEQISLWGEMKGLLRQHRGPFFFLDLHTTSSPSKPFLTINDVIANRNFALKFEVPVVLGIEEYLTGPLLSYINELDHVAVGFEAGSHTDPESVNIHEAFIRRALVQTGVMDASHVPGYQEAGELLRRTGGSGAEAFDIRFRHSVVRDDGFEMRPGYKNFQQVHKDEILANDNKGAIYAKSRARIFMPLYQSQGDDGFFLIRRIPVFSLWLSSILRRWGSERLLCLLPGVSLHEEVRDMLVVDLRTARFLATDVFHLLGYRRKMIIRDKMYLSRREIAHSPAKN